MDGLLWMEKEERIGARPGGRSMSKSDKLFEMLRLIEEFPDLKASDLAQLIGTSERAIYRYLYSLRAAGFSIQMRDGGYKLEGDYSDILRKLDIESLEALKVLLSEGMRVCGERDIVERGRGFMRLITQTLARELRGESHETENQ